jgi:hypothetical protein
MSDLTYALDLIEADFDAAKADADYWAGRYDDVVEKLRDIERGIFTASEVLEDLKREGDIE